MTPPVDARRALEQALSDVVCEAASNAFMLACFKHGDTTDEMRLAGGAAMREALISHLLQALSVAQREETPAQLLDHSMAVSRGEEVRRLHAILATIAHEHGEVRASDAGVEANMGVRVQFGFDQLKREYVLPSLQQPTPRPETGETLARVAMALAKNVRGIVGIEEAAIRELVGNSNVACLWYWCEKVEAAIQPPPPASAAPATEERSSRNIPTCFCGHAIISCGYDHETSRVYGKCDACGGMLLGPTRSDWLRHAPAPAERERR